MRTRGLLAAFLFCAGSLFARDSSKTVLDIGMIGSDFEIFPILNYDTDIGFGYGLKAFWVNPLDLVESYDLILFNSTKGERWYRFQFSLPDMERRQGKCYPIAIDLLVDYDLMLKQNYFGTGNRSKYDEGISYTQEPLEVRITASRGFTPRIVGQAGFFYKGINNYNIERNAAEQPFVRKLISGKADYMIFFTTWRYDSRDSYINPSKGTVALAELDGALGLDKASPGFIRYAVELQYVWNTFNKFLTHATRIRYDNLYSDSELPVGFLLPMGGNRTLRGSPQNRYLDKTLILVNTELRWPIWWRFGGTVGIDAGKVWSSPDKIDLPRWAWNPVAGLRFYMDNFVVRFDLGFGKETTGIYFNFGHVF